MKPTELELSPWLKKGEVVPLQLRGWVQWTGKAYLLTNVGIAVTMVRVSSSELYVQFKPTESELSCEVRLKNVAIKRNIGCALRALPRARPLFVTRNLGPV